MVWYRIYPRDQYNNRLNLTSDGVVQSDAYSIEFDLPAYYNYSTVSLSDWNVKFEATPKVIVNVVDNKYYEFQLNFTKKGETYVRPTLYG